MNVLTISITRHSLSETNSSFVTLSPTTASTFSDIGILTGVGYAVYKVDVSIFSIEFREMDGAIAGVVVAMSVVAMVDEVKWVQQL